MATRRRITPLRRAIGAAGLTQRDLANVLSMDEADISRYVNGVRHPSENRKERIANVLRLQVSDLWPTSTPEEGKQ